MKKKTEKGEKTSNFNLRSIFHANKESEASEHLYVMANIVGQSRQNTKFRKPTKNRFVALQQPLTTDKIPKVIGSDSMRWCVALGMQNVMPGIVTINRSTECVSVLHGWVMDVQGKSLDPLIPGPSACCMLHSTTFSHQIRVNSLQLFPSLAARIDAYVTKVEWLCPGCPCAIWIWYTGKNIYVRIILLALF